jgi:putative ABC transport system ATP-binding protein
VTGGRIAELLFDLNTRSGTTLVLVTHDRSLAARCNRVWIMEAGRLAPG